MTTPIPRMTVVTLGVEDLEKSTKFYEELFQIFPNPDYEGVAFFELPGAWLALFPFEELAKDAGLPETPPRPAFGGVTLAYNAKSRDEVLEIFRNAAAIGAEIVKEPQPTFWGGFSGYFRDINGFYWEVVWGPMFEFGENGDLKFKPS